MVRRSRQKDRRKHYGKSVGPGRVPRLGALSKSTAQYLKRHWVAVRSILIFAVCIAVFMFVYSLTAGSEQLLGLRTFIAGATGAILGLFSSDINVVGTSVTSPAFSMAIITACTGLVAMGIYASAVLAYPCNLIRKAEGIAIGIFGLFILNLIRMVGLFLVGSYIPAFFESAHYVIGQSLMILAAIGLWLFWLEKRVSFAQR